MEPVILQKRRSKIAVQRWRWSEPLAIARPLASGKAWVMDEVTCLDEAAWRQIDAWGGK